MKLTDQNTFKHHFLNSVVTTSVVLAALTFTVSAQAQNSDPFHFHGADARCYQQSVEATSGKTSGAIRTSACNAALGNRHVSNANRAGILHNRGLIERHNGDLDAARASLEAAVAYKDTVDASHLALAQVAHLMGDYSTAIELYDQVLNAESDDATIAAHRDAITRNRLAALDAMATARIASTK